MGCQQPAHHGISLSQVSLGIRDTRKSRRMAIKRRRSATVMHLRPRLSRSQLERALNTPLGSIWVEA